MSTRSNIGILNTDGTIDFIYCHWDGYPDHNGAILHEHYLDEAKVRALTALGAISSLDVRVSPKSDRHCFSFPEGGTVIAYIRDRGEDPDGLQTQTTSVRKEMHQEEYAYLFDPETSAWTFCAHDSIWHPLDEAL